MTSFDFEKIPVRPVGAGGVAYIELADSADDPRASEAARALMQLFEVRTGGTRLLKRTDFTPMDIKKYLPNIIILDLVFGENGKVRDGTVRLMGSALAGFYGEYTGRSVLEHPSKSGDRFIRSAQLAVDANGTVIGGAEQAAPDQPYYKVETLVMPVVDEADAIVQMLCHVQLFTPQGVAITASL